MHNEALITVSVSPITQFNWQNKVERDNFQQSFTHSGVTISQLVEIITYPSNYSIVPSNYIKSNSNSSWLGQQMLILEFSSVDSITSAVERLENLGIYPNFINTINTVEVKENYPLRLVIVLDKVIDNNEELLEVRKQLLETFPGTKGDIIDSGKVYQGGFPNIEINNVKFTSIEMIKDFIIISNYTKKNRNNKKPRAESIRDFYLSLYNIYSNKQFSLNSCDNELRNPTADADKLSKINLIQRNKRNNFNIDLCISRVKIFQEFVKYIDGYRDYQMDFPTDRRLSYAELHGLASNLLYINGGENKYKQAIDSYNLHQTDHALMYSDEQRDIYTYLKQVLKHFPEQAQLPMPLEQFSPYESDWELGNLINAVKTNQGDVNVLESQIGTDLKETEQRFNKELDNSFKDTDKSVSLFIKATALGGTKELETRENITIAYSNHALKEQVHGRMKVEHVVSPDMPTFSEKLDREIKNLYALKRNADVSSMINSIAKGTHLRYKDEKDVRLASEYLEALRLAYNANCTVLTTHHRAIYDNYKNDTIVFDEDIISKLIRYNHVMVGEIEGLYIKNKDIAGLKEFVDDLKNLEPGKAMDTNLHGMNIDDITGRFSRIDININILKLFTSEKIFKDSENTSIIHFVRVHKLPTSKKIIIMSATASPFMYKQLLGERLKVYDFALVKGKGTIKQFTYRNYSKEYMKKAGDEKLISLFSEPGWKVITHKDYSHLIPVENRSGIHFGNSEGFDHLKGQNIRIFGTHRYRDIDYIMYALAVEIDVNSIDLDAKEQMVEWRGFRFRFITFDDERLRNLQLEMIAGETIQCAGRARTLRTNAIVEIYSSLPVPITNEFILENPNKK